MALLAVGPVAQGGSITFTDGTFAPSDWSAMTQFSQGPMSAPACQLNQGNPAPGRQHVPQSGSWSGSGSLYVAHFNSNFFYDPSVSGAIENLDF